MKFRDGLTPEELTRHDELQAVYDGHKAGCASVKPEINALRMRGYQRLNRRK